MKDKDSARESNDSSVSNVQSVEKPPKAHNRVEARTTMQPFQIIVSYRPLLSFVADLYFGTPLIYATRRSLSLCFTFLSGNLPLPAQNFLHSPRSPLSFSVLLPSDHLLILTVAALHWLAPPESLALGFGGRRACGSVLRLLYLAFSVR